MKRKLTVAFMLVSSLVALSSPVFAHHGTEAYDLNHPITVKGIIAEMVWSNPHVQVYFDVKDDKGKVVRWSCETYSPGKLIRSGWSKGSLKPGDQVTITLQPSKSGAPVGFLRKLVFANGKELGLQEMPPEY